MARKRGYEDGCAFAHALDLLGERWALLVVRELILGPKRFTDLRAGLPGIGPNVLTQRLEDLENAGVTRHRRLPPPGPISVYELTPWGLELEPAIQALGRWAARSPALNIDSPMSVDAFVLSLRTMFDGNAAAGMRAMIRLEIAGQPFAAELNSGKLRLERGEVGDTSCCITGDVAAFLGVVYGGEHLSDAQRAGHLLVTGDKTIARRFLKLFPMAAPAHA